MRWFKEEEQLSLDSLGERVDVQTHGACYVFSELRDLGISNGDP